MQTEGAHVMKQTLLLVLAVAGLAARCAGGMKLVVNWRSQNYAGGSFRNILVLALNGKVAGRTDFEDALAAAISRPGAQASASYVFLPRPDATPIDMEELKTLVQWQKFDAIIVVRLTKASERTVYVPGQVYSPVPYYGTFYGYYRTLYPVVYSPGYLKNEKKAQAEVNLYSTAQPQGELVWTGTTEIVEVGSVKKAIKDLVNTVSKELEQQRFIEPQAE